MDDINRLCEDLREDADWLDSIFPEQPDISDNRLTKRASLKLDRIAEAVRETATLIETQAQQIATIRREAMEEAARVIEKASDLTFCCPDAWTGGNVKKRLSKAIRALAQDTSTTTTKKEGEVT